MNKIEQMLDSREVAEMVGKEHKMLLRDIRRYCKQLGESKIALTDFFEESTYRTGQNKILPCYKVTKKGCEFIAHKLTGTKGTIFTARYINRFHEMEDIIKQQNTEPGLPWFIREFRGKYIILERDFISITGADIRKHKMFYRMEYFKGGLDYNGWGWKCDNEKFKQEYGFDYGEDDCMMYFYPCGVIKALRILTDDRKIGMKQGAAELILDGLEQFHQPKKKETEVSESKPVVIVKENGNDSSVKLTIILKMEA